MINFRTKTKRSLTKVIEKALEQIAGNRMHIDISLTQPPNNTLGDYAFACFHCARMLGKNPSEFSKILALKLIQALIKYNIDKIILYTRCTFLILLKKIPR